MSFHSFDDQKNQPVEDTTSEDASSSTTAGPQENAMEDDAQIVPDDSSDVSKLEQEISALKEQVLRAMAESENIRKRTIKEKEELAKYAVADFSRSLLGVADNLRRALESSQSAEKVENSQLQGIIAGIEMTEKELATIFEKYGIRKISPKGEKFDPHAHQAVMEVDSEQQSGTVVDVLQAGYLIHDRVLRPAMVSVAKNK